jgi:NTE family protein
MFESDVPRRLPPDDLVGLLSSTRLFSELARPLLERVAKVIRPLTFRAGASVVTEGESADSFFVLRSGLLEVVAGPASERIRLLQPGVAFGELALLGGRTRTATVRALRDSEVWGLSREAFDELLASETEFARTMVHALTQLVFESHPQPTPKGIPSVIAIIPLHPDAPAGAVLDAFAVNLAPARVHILRRSDDAPPDWAHTVEAAERDNDVVLVVASDRRDQWFEFCVRESDRVVAVANRTAVIEPLDPACRPDLVVFGHGGRGVAPLLARVRPRAHHLVSPHHEAADLGRAVRRITNRSIGIVLSGGGARGLAHIGVLDALTDAGITIDRFGGVSMGALVGALAARAYTPRQIAHNLHHELVDRRPFADYGVPRVSLIRARRARAMLERLLGGAQIEDLANDFFCVSADLVAAEPVVHRTGSLVAAVGASMSLPGLAPPLRDGPRILVDGGVLENLPVETMLHAEAGPIIAVDVLARGVPGARRPLRGAEPQLPSLLETVARSTTLGSRRRAEEQRLLATVTIVPDLRDVGLLDFARFEAIVESGRHAAQDAIVEAQALLRF